MNDREYELFVGRLIEYVAKNDLVITPGVVHRGRYRGKTGEEYEIDLSFRFQVANAKYLTLIECKHWNQRVGRDVISAFHSVVTDIAAHKGIVVTTKGFESGAVRLAAKNGIALFKVSDREDFTYEVVRHFTEHEKRTIEFLTREDIYVSGRPFRRADGIVRMATHIIDYVAALFGEQVAALLSLEPGPSLDDVVDEDIKSQITDQLLAMGDHWVVDYLNIEACGMDLRVTPYMDVRIISVKASVNYREALRLRGEGSS
jgi:hypothetical protein